MGGHLKSDPCDRASTLAVIAALRLRPSVQHSRHMNLAAGNRTPEDKGPEREFTPTRAVDAPYRMLSVAGF